MERFYFVILIPIRRMGHFNSIPKKKWENGAQTLDVSFVAIDMNIV